MVSKIVISLRLLGELKKNPLPKQPQSSDGGVKL